MALPDHYATLGLTRGAPDLLIKKAYRQLVLRYHPDRNPGDRVAEEKFKQIAEAYETLSRQDKRAQYDELLASAQRSHQERMADSMRRQQERQEQARERSRARARRPRSTKPGYKGWQMGMEYRSNEFDRRDVLLGMIAGATLSTIFGAYFGKLEFSFWLVVPFLGALVGKRVGLWLEERWEPRVADLSVGAELLAPLQILVAPLAIVIGADLAVMGVRSWATLAADGIFGGGVAGGVGAALGGGFGRAFTSVAKRTLSRNAGIAIGAAIGAGFGALSASFLAMNLLSRWVDNGNYDSFLATVLAGLFGAALGGAQGSRRN